MLNSGIIAGNLTRSGAGNARRWLLNTGQHAGKNAMTPEAELRGVSAVFGLKLRLLCHSLVSGMMRL